jgi:hypothetical protein
MHNEHIIARWRYYVSLFGRMADDYRNRPSHYTLYISELSRFYLADCCDAGVAWAAQELALESGMWERELDVFTG